MRIDQMGKAAPLYAVEFIATLKNELAVEEHGVHHLADSWYIHDLWQFLALIYTLKPMSAAHHRQSTSI